MEEVLIAKIDKVNDFGVGIGIAQGIEWQVYRIVQPETDLIEVGQFVSCRVNYDEDNDAFYLLRLENNYYRNEAEWLAQESKVL